MITSDDFPRLTPANHRVTSPATSSYNCIAWAAGDTTHWWQPGVFWPVSSSRDDFGLAALEAAFRALGYADCGDDDSPEPGFEKVALYGNVEFYSHAAKQLPTGKWTSKLGREVDIEHDTPHDVAGGIYGELMQLMKRLAG